MAPRGFSGSDLPDQKIMDDCIRCGLCLPACPTYVETLVETSSPRGRIALIKLVAEEKLDITSPGFVHQMSECLDCRACEPACPSGVQYGRLLETTRAQVQRATRHQLPWNKRLLRSLSFRWLLNHYTLLRFAAQLLRTYQRTGLQEAMRKSGVLKALGLAEIEALAPPISDTFFLPSNQRWPAEGTRKSTVFLHAGCITHVAFSEVDEATLRMLQRVGCDVVSPTNQGCCGALFIDAGERSRARALAKRTIASFEASGADFYISNAAGCGNVLKEYPLLFEGDAVWETRAQSFALIVRDITEFLDEVGLPPGIQPLEAIVTYQEPCHLVHAQRISGAPRRLLQQIPGLLFREMPESSLCCGSVGSYMLTQPEMAQQLQRRKIANALKVDPAIIATANPGCALQVKNGLRELGSSVIVKHVVELLDAAYGNAGSSKFSLSLSDEVNPLSRSAPLNASSSVE